MKSFQFWASLVLVVTSFKSGAHSFFFKTKEIGEGTYRNRTQLFLKTNDLNVKNVSVEFKGRNGLVTAEKWQKRFQSQDFNECKEFPCSIPVLGLPISLEGLSCHLSIVVSENSGATTEHIHNWGKCHRPAVKTPERFLPDLTLFEETSSVKEFSVFNEGASLIDKRLKVLSFVEDRNGNVIWADSQDQRVSLSSGDQVFIQSAKPLRTWQEKTGCFGYVIVDSEQEIQEKKKKNNELKFPFGSCEQAPSQEAGDHFDFRPVVKYTGDLITYEAVNDGRLPMLNDYEKLEYTIYYLSSDARVVSKRLLSVSSPFYGFGEMKKVHEEEIPSGICRIEVQLNANFVLNESNYQNNKTIFNICN